MLTLKSQQRLKSERHNAFTKEISKIALSSNDRLLKVPNINSWRLRIGKNKFVIFFN